MALLLAFLPFIAFVLADRLLGTAPGLLAGAACATAMVLNDLRRRQAPRLLEIGTAGLFCALATWALLDGGAAWSLAGVRLRVDAGLLAIVLLSLLLRRPFTMQYAAGRVPASVASSPRFLRTHLVVTTVWAAAFAALVLADAVLVLRPQWPLSIAVALTAAALAGAIKFSAWYPHRAIH